MFSPDLFHTLLLSVVAATTTTHSSAVPVDGSPKGKKVPRGRRSHECLRQKDVVTSQSGPRVEIMGREKACGGPAQVLNVGGKEHEAKSVRKWGVMSFLL